jgi:hypothetical protein
MMPRLGFMRSRCHVPERDSPAFSLLSTRTRVQPNRERIENLERSVGSWSGGKVILLI